MLVVCRCGRPNSAFNPRCLACGAPVVEHALGGAPPPEPMGASSAFALGSDVGGYELVATLGAGALGRVFRARKKSDGSPAAIKVLHPHLLQNADARSRFVQEARALLLVRHRSIGRVLDVFETASVPVLVLELYGGESLRVLMQRRGPLSPRQALPLLRELTEALGASHDAGWVHRDVKPENVMILDPGEDAPRDVRLLDFGLVKSLDPDLSAGTAAGAFVGSIAYAAPEQIFGEPIGPQADWWALGVVAYEMLSNRRPFEGATRTEMAGAVVRGEFAKLAVGPPLGPWMERLLIRDPTLRPADWRDVMRGLAAAA